MWPNSIDVARQCFGNRWQQWIDLRLSSLQAKHAKNSSSPVHLIKAQRNHFTTAHSINRQEHQDRAVSYISRLVGLGGSQDALNVGPVWCVRQRFLCVHAGRTQRIGKPPVPALLIDTLREQWDMLSKLDQQILQIEQRLLAWMRQDQACKVVAKIPGVGLLTATAAVATMGDAKTFKSGREFAAWLGLVPAQTGTGGRVKLLGISKRGDTYLRTLLTHGARSALLHTKEPGKWLQDIAKRRPPNVVVVALANKMARTIWALLAHGREYDGMHVSVRPA